MNSKIIEGVAMSQNYIPTSRLSSFGTTEQNQFMHKVYELHCETSSKRRKFTGELSPSQLGTIEGGTKARKDAATMCSNLLKLAREDLAKAQQKKLVDAIRVKNIGVSSGYRSAERQFKNWQKYFPRYYQQTKVERSRLTGGEHGDKAIHYLKSYIAKRLAAPGFSLHNTGIAIDFKTVDNGITLGPSKSQTKIQESDKKMENVLVF